MPSNRYFNFVIGVYPLDNQASLWLALCKNSSSEKWELLLPLGTCSTRRLCQQVICHTVIQVIQCSWVTIRAGLQCHGISGTVARRRVLQQKDPGLPGWGFDKWPFPLSYEKYWLWKLDWMPRPVLRNIKLKKNCTGPFPHLGKGAKQQVALTSFALCIFLYVNVTLGNLLSNFSHYFALMQVSRKNLFGLVWKGQVLDCFCCGKQHCTKNNQAKKSSGLQKL